MGESAGVAALWDLTTSEVFDLKAYLVDNYDLGLQLDGWTLLCAQGISDNGLVITGCGTDANGDTQAFVAAIPEPSTYALLALASLSLLVLRRRAKTA